MKVINISLDPKILGKDTPAAKRAKAYGEMVEKYFVVVPTPHTMTVELSDNVTIYGISGLNKVVQLFNIYKKLNQLVKTEKIDLISSVDMYYLGLASVLVSRRHHLGLEMSVLGIEKLSPVRKTLAQFVLRRASLIRALSHRLKERLISEFGIDEKNIVVTSIYVPTDNLGLDVRSLSPAELHDLEVKTKEFKEKYNKHFNFLTVSRLVSIKHIERQITALKNISKDLASVRLHVVGDGPDEGRLKQVVKELGVEDLVIFHGRKTGYELGLFYAECDCFLLTSDYEGWGMVIVEAATAGMPAIMSDVGCAGEFLINEESGLVVPVGDVDALAAAMKRMATEKELRQQLSYGTKKSLNELESFADILQQYRANWERALANKL